MYVNQRICYFTLYNLRCQLEDCSLFPGDTMRLSDITEAYKNATPEERQEFIEQITPDLEEKITIIIEKVLLTSELKPIKRIADLEGVTGLKDYSDFEEDHEPTIPDQINILTEKIGNLSGEPIKRPDNVPTGKTEIRACKLVERLKQAREIAGNKFLSSDDIVNFLKHGLDETLRVNEGQNVRQVKKEVLEKAAKMFSGQIFISQKTTGRKNLRLVLKT